MTSETATGQPADPTTLADLGEDRALALIVPRLPAGLHTILPSGDDAAVLGAPDGRYVVTTDALVEGHHFRRDWSSAADVGWRAAMQNFADVAAMGASPTGLIVALGVPPTTPIAWLEGLADGLTAACNTCGAGVVGGDLTAAEQVFVSITAFGDLAGRAPVTRAGARAGDVLAFAGTLGRSAAGLAVLNANVRPSGASDLEAAYRRPEPPLEAGPAAAVAGAHALMDVSDGLLRDAGRMARASGVVIDLMRGALEPDAARLAAVAKHLGADPMEWVLSGGEDHCLLAAFPPGRALPSGYAAIGRVVAPSDQGEVLLDGALAHPASVGWDHFADEALPTRPRETRS